MEKMYSISEVAGMFGVHPNTVRNWVSSGKVKEIRIKGTIRITESELSKVMDGK